LHPNEYAKVRSGEVQLSTQSEGARIAEEPGVWRPQSSRTPPPDEDALLTSGQVRARYGGVSAMCIWRWQRNPAVRFPMPDVVITNRSYWRLGTLRRWDAARDGAT
jgi:hypothetical protein